MAESPERKWKTLRTIAPLQGKSPVPPSPAPPPDPEAPPELLRAGPGPIPDQGGTGEPVAILVAHPVVSTVRLIRETLEQFTAARVYTTADPVRAFELALQRRLGLFYFAMQIGEISGPMLYELISRACASGHGQGLVAPGVVLVREKGDPKLPEALARDVRVKDVLSKPIRIERLLESVAGVLEVKDPTAR